MSEERSSKRIDKLEIIYTLQEDLIEQLNEIVTEQQFMIDKIRAELTAIKMNMENQSNKDVANPMNEKPPHY